MIASRDISVGEELTHSYVELVDGTLKRNLHLRSSYGFECDCVRCLFYSDRNTKNIQNACSWMGGASGGGIGLGSYPTSFTTSGSFKDIIASKLWYTPSRLSYDQEDITTINIEDSCCLLLPHIDVRLCSQVTLSAHDYTVRDK